MSDGGRTGRDLTIRAPTRSLTVLLAAGTLVVALAAESAKGVPLPKPRPASAPAKVGANTTTAASTPQAASRPPRSTLASSETASPADITALKDAITAARRGK